VEPAPPTPPLYDGTGLLIAARYVSQTVVQMTVQVRDYDGAVVDRSSGERPAWIQITGTTE
jgi:hypothetical protein